MNKPAIIFNNVSFAYDQTPVLQKGNFVINEKEFVGIIGPNGGGKTTAFNLIMGFLKPQSGHIQVLAKPPKIGYVPQVTHYDKQFPISALDVVLTGVVSKVNWLGMIPREEKTKAAKLLCKMGLEKSCNKPFSALSGGQAQRVLIARSLISDPEILLLDEPTANIDPGAEAEIMEVIRSLKNKITILFISHDFETIIKEVEKVLIFQKKITTLKPSEICDHFAIGLYHDPDIKHKMKRDD
ncbi:MAG: ABC transporter ATP-binding protein [Simkaniaceae bacterium]|nr:ABC transporter ATP-binding protein [Simkaniaceae bacterium]